MPHPELRPVDNGVYYAFWSAGRRSKRKSMGTSDHVVAHQRFAEWLGFGGDKQGVVEESEKVYLVEDCWAIYDEKHVKRHSLNADRARYSWQNLAPHFGLLTIPKVSQDVCDDYVAKRIAGRIGRPAKENTCRRELNQLFAAIRFCAEKPQSLFASTIIETVRLPAEGEPRDRWLRIEEIKRLFKAAAELRRGPRLSRVERFLWLALETAARKTAILELTWDRVDFETGTIHYPVPGAKLTKKRRVTVAMSSSLRPVLKRAYEERTSEFVCDHSGDVWKGVQVVAARAGFGDGSRTEAYVPVATGIGPHVLRHTAATHMARNGVPLWKIAKILGNTLAVVERTYAKWAPDSTADTVDLISGGALDLPV